MATVVIPTPLRDLCAGAAHLEVPGATLGEVLREVDSRCPGFYDRVVENGRVRPELAVAIDGEMESAQLHDPIGTNAEIAIVPAIAGGQDDGTAVWAMADLVTPMAIRVAATLRIADALGTGQQTATELAPLIGADAGILDRLLRHLAVKGLFVRTVDGRYTVASRGEALWDDHPAGLRCMLDIEGSIGRADLALVQLLHSVRTGEPAFPLQFGQPFWEDLAADPARVASFDAQMASDIAADAPAIVAAYDWGSLGWVVDVGGGAGALLTAMLAAFPALRGTVFDQPQTAARASIALAAADVESRADAVPGSFFESVPAGAGGYLLSAILHNWDDDSARLILRRCAAAAGAEGAVFVIEKIGADGETLRTAMDLRALAYFGGKERGVTELCELAGECGLRAAAVHPAGKLAVLELRPV